MSPEKPPITSTTIEPLILEERKKLGHLNVDTFKKRKAEYARQRSLAWYHLIRANVIKAFAHAQAAVDVKQKKNPNSECLLAYGAPLTFYYESNADRDIRLAAQKAAAERKEALGEHVVNEVFAKMNADAGS